MDTAMVASQPGIHSRSLKLRDGSSVVIRPIQTDDKALLREGVARLSQRTLYRRFGTVVRELSEEQLRYLTEVDEKDHVAWVAIDSSSGRDRVVGVARYIRLDNDPTAAEVAVTVADSHQGRGLGTTLLAILAESARSNRVERFLAFVSWDNAPVLKLVREFGAGIRFLGSGMVRVTGAVPTPEACLAQAGW